MSVLSDPHVVSFVCAFEGPGSELVLLTEFLSGGELFERVAAEQFDLTEAECVLFTRQICRGVQYLHEKVSNPVLGIIVRRLIMIIRRVTMH